MQWSGGCRPNIYCVDAGVTADYWRIFSRCRHGSGGFPDRIFVGCMQGSGGSPTEYDGVYAG